MNINKIYELILDGKTITHDTLISLGYDEFDVDRMVESKLLSYENGEYKPINVDSMYAYYKKVSKSTDYQKSSDLLDMILAIKPNHGGALFQKFYISLKLGDNYGALEAFEKEYKLNHKELYKNDSRLQLFLLDKLINVGPELYQDIRDLSFDDIKVHEDDDRYSRRELHNKAREAILDYKFEDAYNMLYANKEYNAKITFQELVIKTLLNRIIHTYKNGHNYKECIIDARFGDALYALSLRSNLTHYEKLVKYLLEFLINPPQEIYVNLDHEEGLWEAIEANDFEKALEMNESYNYDKKIDDNNSPINIVLKEIIDMLSYYEHYNEGVINVEPEQVEEQVVEEETVIEEEHRDIIRPDVVKTEPALDKQTIDNFDRVHFISELIDQGLSFEEALYHACYDEHTNGYVTLIYAREAYRTGNTKMGDKLMARYNHSTNKDQENNTLYKRIIESKKFLPYRPSELSNSITIPKKLTRNK